MLVVVEAVSDKFLFCSMCRCQKSYVDDIILGTLQVGGFCVLVGFVVGVWLSLL